MEEGCHLSKGQPGPGSFQRPPGGDPASVVEHRKHWRHQDSSEEAAALGMHPPSHRKSPSLRALVLSLPPPPQGGLS